MTIPAKKGGGGGGAAVVDPESLKCKFVFVNDNVVTGKSSLRQKTRKHAKKVRTFCRYPSTYTFFFAPKGCCHFQREVPVLEASLILFSAK